MSTSNIFMLKFYLFMSTCKIIMLTCNIIMSACKIIMLTYDWNEVASKHNDLICWHDLSWMKGQIKATVVFLSDNNAIKRAWTQTIYRYWFIVVKLLELNVQLYPKSLHHKHSQYKINRNLDLNEIFSDSDWILLTHPGTSHVVLFVFFMISIASS